MIQTGQRSQFGHVVGQANRVVTRVLQAHFRDFCPVDSWSPAINLYQLEEGLELCVDLAGVVAKSLDLRVEPGSLTIRGVRAAPEPKLQRPRQAMRIITMEIDHGPFCRVIPLPEQVDLARLSSEYEGGLLWVHLPMRKQG